MNAKDVGKRITDLRIRAKLSTKALAEYLGVSEETLKNIEGGNPREITAVFLMKLADLFGCSEDYILRGEYPESACLSFDYSNFSKEELEKEAIKYSKIRRRSKSVAEIKKAEEAEKLKPKVEKPKKSQYFNPYTPPKRNIVKKSKSGPSKSTGNYIRRYNNMSEKEKQKEFEETVWLEYFFENTDPFSF